VSAWKKQKKQEKQKKLSRRPTNQPTHEIGGVWAHEGTHLRWHHGAVGLGRIQSREVEEAKQ
jgi:hypothetical protein